MRRGQLSAPCLGCGPAGPQLKAHFLDSLPHTPAPAFPQGPCWPGAPEDPEGGGPPPSQAAGRACRPRLREEPVGAAGLEGLGEE